MTVCMMWQVFHDKLNNTSLLISLLDILMESSSSSVIMLQSLDVDKESAGKLVHDLMVSKA